MKFCVFSTLCLFFASNIQAVEIASPNGEIEANFFIKSTGSQSDCLFYAIQSNEKVIIAPSQIAFRFSGQELFEEHLSVSASDVKLQDSTWKPVYGERSQVRDRYNELTITVAEKNEPHRKINIHVRVYNEGVAFCYEFPKQDALQSFTIESENTEFKFENDSPAWATYSAQGLYEKRPISKIKNGCERPLTVQVSDDCFVSLAEARLVDYARTKFDPTGEGQPGVITALSSDVHAEAPYRTPWRVVMIAESAGALLENNDLILNLNDPCAIEDASWIKPGKVIRETSLTTTGGMACVDFAVRNGLQYIEFDAGWYGLEYDDASDATTITVDPDRSPGPLDLHKVIEYAKQKDIGVIVYVNRRALEKQLDVILPLYKKWGIAGVKYGFVNVGSQKWTAWLHDAVRKAADHQLMVDIHDEYRPTGYSRTYPNLMTQEGIRGDETKPTNDQTLTIFFTRMLAGAGDNTICYYDPRVIENASHAYQLAKAVCFYSPWQFVYWYDSPAEIEQEDNREIEFFAQVPTVWDDTRVLDAAIGEYAVMARRSGDEWFIGCMNAATPRDIRASLSFLEEGVQYEATMYSTDKQLNTRTKVAISKQPVNSTTLLNLHLVKNDGIAIRIAKQNTN
ncbi:MAG: glycoside hydrolase family 97 N-terminal domain-containing protein [Candidatus Hinthialibacter antarcticus]|nr:glycoside hydrolase family 97 N-terminal domain-containing protein [Candidatus Hinthialibacter antarcticus]